MLTSPTSIPVKKGRSDLNGNMTIKIDWLGKIGYGDICSPIAYAHNLSDKLDEHVRLVFHWSHSQGVRTYSEDPETIDDRASRIFELMRPANASLKHVYNSSMIFDEDNPHTNYRFYYDAHNHWWSTVTHKCTSNRIVICPPTENMIPFSRNKAWKDPLGEKWISIIEHLDADVVSYRTPMNELIQKLLDCRLFMGYHGSCAWVARHLRVPMVLFSKNQNITRKMFPAKVGGDISILSDIDQLVQECTNKVHEFDSALLKYSYPTDFLSSIIHC